MKNLAVGLFLMVSGNAVWAGSPGSVPDLSGEYWYGSTSVNTNSNLPWGEVGTVIVSGSNWHQEWDDPDGHHSLSSTFTTSIQPDGSVNLNHTWGTYKVAWNGSIMLNADTAPDENNRLGVDLIVRKVASVDVNDVIGTYSFFGHWLDRDEPDASVGWGSLSMDANGSGLATWVEQDGDEHNRIFAWTVDDVNGVIRVPGLPDGLVCENDIIIVFRATSDVPGDFGYNFFVKDSNDPITPDDIAGTYLVRHFETSVSGHPFTCGRGSAVIRADQTASIDCYYSDGEHDVFDIDFTIGPANRFHIEGSEHVNEGVISPDLGLIFVPEYQVRERPTIDDWIGGIFLVRTACNIADLDGNRRVDWLDFAIFSENWLWNANWME